MSEKSKPENTIGYIGNIDGEGIYERLNSSKRPESFLNLAMVEDKLNRAISGARVIWGGAALSLGAQINVDEYKAFEPLPSCLEEHFRGLWKDPSNRHAILGFYSMKDALSELLTARDTAQLQSGTLSQGGLLSLLDAFQSFGFGMSVLTDGSIKEDFDEMRKQGVREGVNVRQTFIECLQHTNVLTVPKFTGSIVARDSWIAQMKASGTIHKEICRLWNEMNPENEITAHIVKNAGQDKAPKKSRPKEQPLESVVHKIIAGKRKN